MGRFRDNFCWGVATAAFQVEGGANAGGRRPSVWDALCKKPGAIYHGHTGDTACDQYHRLDEDIGLLKELGVKAYRFSIAWPRLMASETEINPEGADYYKRLAGGLREAGIEPWPTLFHWDFPLDLFREGGWLNRASADWFARYASAAATTIGDAAAGWFTHNEPQIFLELGHASGIHAPGMKYDRGDQVNALHNVLRAHGSAFRAIKDALPDAPVGIAGHDPIRLPANPDPRAADPADVEDARRDMFAAPTDDGWLISCSWYLDPICLGHYPEGTDAFLDEHLGGGWRDDLQDIQTDCDFIGMNIYRGGRLRANPADTADPERLPLPVGFPQTVFHWEITPDALYWGPRFVYERYNKPIYITENGCAAMDWVHADGQVHDAPRIDFLARHLAQLSNAHEDGVDVRGYFQWSMLDNFEWAEGYRMRFGLIYVDYETLERTPKDSYRWYQEVIRTNGGSLPTDPAPLR